MQDGSRTSRLEYVEGGSLDKQARRGRRSLPPGRRLVAPAGPGHARRPPARHRPPRPQAGQRPADGRTARPRSPTSAWPSSWTTRAVRLRPADPGHAQLHGPRAGRRADRGRRPGCRRLRPGGDPLRAADGPAAVPGRRPLLETLQQVRSQEPVPPRRLQPSVPRDLETICLKCLQKEPRQALRHRRSAGGRPGPLPRRPADPGTPCGRGERLAKWIRREPAAASLIGTALLLLVCVLGWVSYAWRAAEAGRAAEARQACGRRPSGEKSSRQLYFNRIALADRDLSAASRRGLRSSWSCARRRCASGNGTTSGSASRAGRSGYWKATAAGSAPSRPARTGRASLRRAATAPCGSGRRQRGGWKES